MPNLIIDFAGCGHCLGHFFAQEIPMPLSQPVDRGFDGAFAQAQPRRDFCVGAFGLFARLEMLQLLK